VNESLSNPCMKGTCIDLVNGFQCICSGGFTGDQSINQSINQSILGVTCNEDIPECGSSPCLNGGTCVKPVPNAFVCVCPPGVAGAFCDIVTYATFDGTSVLQIFSSLSGL
jgi:hypothetical protein